METQNYFFQVVGGFQEACGPLMVGTKSGVAGTKSRHFLERGMLLLKRVFKHRELGYSVPMRRLKVEKGAMNSWETEESNSIQMVNIHPICCAVKTSLGESTHPRDEPKHKTLVFS